MQEVRDSTSLISIKQLLPNGFTVAFFILNSAKESLSEVSAPSGEKPAWKRATANEDAWREAKDSLNFRKATTLYFIILRIKERMFLL